jgi:hypothetical protein
VTTSFHLVESFSMNEALPSLHSLCLEIIVFKHKGILILPLLIPKKHCLSTTDQLLSVRRHIMTYCQSVGPLRRHARRLQ